MKSIVDYTNKLKDFFATKQALTTVEGKLSHRNLLDNPWFTVNQRAITFPHTVGSSAREYLFDRWKFNGGDVVGYSSSGVLTSSGQFFQPLSNEVLNGILGKTVTASILKGDNTIIQGTEDIPSSLTSSITFGSTGIILYSVDGPWVLLVTAPSSGMKAVKLEIGSESTLAMDTMPNYPEELLKCQRYFVRVKAIHYSSYGNVGLGTIQSATRARSFVSIPTEMRTTPTVSASGKFLIKIGGTEYPFTNGTEATISINGGSTTTRAVGLYVNYATSQDFSAQQPCELDINNDVYAYVDFSADM